MPEFRRAHHRAIAKVLRCLNGELFLSAECFFGGGTRIALEFGEFRESRDIDFLCANRSGFRRLRESIDQGSLGQLMCEPVSLIREVRADRDGIRTFFEVDEVRIKFEIVLEARIDLAGALSRARRECTTDGPRSCGAPATESRRFLATAPLLFV